MEQLIKCENCGQELDEDKVTYLNYDRTNDTYTDVPNPNGPEFDELFAFGSACSKKVLENSGKIN